MGMRLFNALSTSPWAITTEGYQLLLDVYSEALRRKAAGETFDWQTLAQKKGIQVKNTQSAEIRDNGIGILSVTGPIFRRADWFTELSGVTSTETLAKDFAKLVEDREVRGIILSCDSPGGEAVGIAEFARQIFAVRGQKPMAAYVDGMCCSGAYWLASAIGPIYTDRIGSSGSIGVVAQIQDFSEAEAMMGIKTYKFRATQSPKKNLEVSSQEGQDAIQRVIDDIADVFIGDVALYRGSEENHLTKQDVIDNYGQGGIMIGRRAVKAGLCDAIANEEELVLKLGREADKQFKPSSVSVIGDSGHQISKKGDNIVKTAAATAIPKAGEEQEDGVTPPEAPTLPADEEVETPAEGAPEEVVTPAGGSEEEGAGAEPEGSSATSPPPPANSKASAKPAAAAAAAAPPAAPAAAALPAGEPAALASGEVKLSAEEYRRLQAQVAQGEIAAKELLTSKAAQRASELVHAGQINPAQKLNAQSTLEMLMSEDEANPVEVAVAFDTKGVVTKTGTRVDAYLASLPAAGSLAAGAMTDETIPTYELPSSKVEEDADAERLTREQAEAKTEVADYAGQRGKK